MVTVFLSPGPARTGIVWQSGGAGRLKRLEHSSQPAPAPAKGTGSALGGFLGLQLQPLGRAAFQN